MAILKFGQTQRFCEFVILTIASTVVALIDYNNIQPFKVMMSIVCIKNGVTIYIDKSLTWAQFMVRGTEC